MENIRIHGSVIESAEFRHGPAEMLDRRGADMAVLLGTDESREMTERTLEFARARGARTRVFDAADHADVHPLLSPFVLKVALQWFIVYSALMRGIDDLDDRAYMGRQRAGRGRCDLAVSVVCVGDNCIDRYVGAGEARRGRAATR